MIAAMHTTRAIAAKEHIINELKGNEERKGGVDLGILLKDPEVAFSLMPRTKCQEEEEAEEVCNVAWNPAYRKMRGTITRKCLCSEYWVPGD